MNKFNKTFQLPFKTEIPNLIQEHLDSVSFYKRLNKFIKRYVYIFLKGQAKLESNRIHDYQKKILWINISAPSLGDSLMDLSGRFLLKDRELDLFTDKKNYHLFENDEFFSKVYCQIDQLNKKKYDLVIIDSYSTRSIKIKNLIAPRTHYVGIYAYFNGPEVNRALFSFFQINSLLGNIKSTSEILSVAKNYISITSKDKNLVSQIIPSNYIAIVLGGEWDYKTYNKWTELIQKISLEQDDIVFVLLGSKNAIKESKKILANFPEFFFINLTNKLSYKQSVEVTRHAKVLICCDGGLFHGACSVDANIVVLLARLGLDMLTTSNSKIYSIFDSNSVNNIDVDAILDKYHAAINLYDNHPPGE